MKPKTRGKLATGLIVLLMVLSVAMVLQWNARAEERHVGSVEGIVQAQDGSLIPEGFNINLENLNEEVTIESQTQKGGYFQFSDLDVGHYKISIPSQTHIRAYHGGESGVLEVTADYTVYEDITVVSKVREHSVNGTVLNEFGDVLEDAQIHLFDGTDYHFQTGIDNFTSGEFEFKMYEGMFNLRVEAEDYAPYMEYDFVINETKNIDVVLQDTPQVSGFLFSDHGYGITTQMEVTLINQEDNTDILRSTMPEGNAWFNIGASEGNYTLIVSAEGYKPFIQDIQIESDDVNYPLRRVEVEKTPGETINTHIGFESWESMTVIRERTLEINSRMMGLDHWYLGNLRMQIDMVFGDGDGIVTQSDVDLFREWLEYREANHPTSQRMLWLEDNIYTLDDFPFDDDLELESLRGDVTDLDVDTITLTSEMHYSVDGELEMEEDDPIFLNLALKNDAVIGNHRDYSYTINLPNGYERAVTENEVIPSGVEIEGYTEITIDTPEGVGRSYLTLEVRLSEEGEASVVLVDDVNVHRLDDQYYAVKAEEEVTLIADLTDPVGREEDANYTWLLDNVEIGKYGSEITHTFGIEDDGEDMNISVRIRQAGGLVIYAYTNILVDGTGPQGEIEVTNEIVDEGETIEFSAYNFTDDSEISEFSWNFSDGTDHITGTNVSHSFELYGTYEVSVNATDVLGNWNVETILITVEDVTPPVARFTLTHEDGEIGSENITDTVRLRRNQEFSLDADRSYDPAGFDGEQSEINIEWWLPGVVQSDTNYSYPQIGTYDIHLNVTDEAGNYNNISHTIEVIPGPTPNIEVMEVFLSEDSIRSGDTVEVIANVTNYGTANATNVNVAFRVDGEPVAITPRFYDVDGEETASNIPIDESRQIRFEWEAEEGEHTLTVNVTDADEPAAWQYDNEMDITVNVDPPQWRTLIGYILVPVIIIGVAVGLYLNKDKVQNMLRK